MRQIFRASLAAVTLIGCFGVTPASADTITITSGQVQATLARGSFSVTGDSLFAAAGLPDGWSSTVALNCSPWYGQPARRAQLQQHMRVVRLFGELE